jgi:hypothetical protein
MGVFKALWIHILKSQWLSAIRLPETTSAVFRRPWKVRGFGACLTFQVHAVSGAQYHLIMSAVATCHVPRSRQIRALIYICKY